MSIRFKTTSKGEFDTGLCETQLNLLAHAQAIELEIGSLCGGHGVCGGDRIRLPLALRACFSPPTDAERQRLSAEELASGIRLACQCFPQVADLEARIDVMA